MISIIETNKNTDQPTFNDFLLFYLNSTHSIKYLNTLTRTKNTTLKFNWRYISTTTNKHHFFPTTYCMDFVITAKSKF